MSECLICFGNLNLIKIENCSHNICNNCLSNHIKNCHYAPAPCPVSNCKSKIQEHIIKEILEVGDLEGYENRSKCQMLGILENGFKCFNCNFVCEISHKERLYLKCLKCAKINCLKCKETHKEMRCDNIKVIEQNTNRNSDSSYVKCPVIGCEFVFEKKSGCGNICCPHCMTEICHHTLKRRWGPKGRGDLSDGCKCGSDKRRCHADCKVGCIPDPYTIVHLIENYYPDEKTVRKETSNSKFQQKVDKYRKGFIQSKPHY